MLGIVAAAWAAYYCGRADIKAELQQVGQALVTERAVRHNLNCLVGDLRHEVKQSKADAAAYNQSKGLWCTDRVDLIKHHARKELFFRLGYPEHRL